MDAQWAESDGVGRHAIIADAPDPALHGRSPLGFGVQVTVQARRGAGACSMRSRRDRAVRVRRTAGNARGRRAASRLSVGAGMRAQGARSSARSFGLDPLAPPPTTDRCPGLASPRRHRR